MTTYYDRTDPSKKYERHLFAPNRGLQSAELNEIQSSASNQIKGIADTLMKDGDVIRDAVCVFDETTGVAKLASGDIYVRGAVRSLASAQFTIPLTGIHSIGVRIIETIITATDDPTLVDPAPGTVNFGLVGADRLKVDAQWGWDGDGQSTNFFPVYTIENGQLGAKQPPPTLDIFNQALARYDRDSAGGTYVVSGLNVTMLPNDSGGNQVYSVDSGRAHVYGFPIEFITTRRVIYNAIPNTRIITSEPHISTTASAQRILFNNAPGYNITACTITSEVVNEDVVHGIVTGAQDPLANTSIVQIVSVTQGATTFVAGTDYQLTADKIDWTPAGAEPAPGSTYKVTYRYNKNVTPTAVDDFGFTVTGAVVGTQILVTYQQKLPRIDKLCLTAQGQFAWVQGVASIGYPQPPEVPDGVLALASVYQTWSSTRTVTNDGVRVVPMPELANISSRIDKVMALIAQNRLESNINTREAGTKLGMFTDPFLDNSQRDAGIPQTAAIVRGELRLPIDASINYVTADISKPSTLNYSHNVLLSQPLRTGDMRINPYDNFSLPPSIIKLTPSVDNWTEVQTSWAGPLTERFVVGTGDRTTTTSSSRTALLSTQNTNIEKLRQIEVVFEVSGFGAGEQLQSLTFDGIPVTTIAV